MKQHKMVAIEMITYNHGRFIRQAIEAVMSQKTDFDYRLYIFDDCSKDDTSTICRELADKYSDKIYYHVNKTNLGVYANAKLMHDMVFNSDAKYIAMCEGDDYWTDNRKLQKQVDFLEQHDDFSICFHKVNIDKEGEILTDYITQVPASITTQNDLLEYDNYIHTPSILVRRSKIVRPDWFETAMPGDYPLYIIVTNQGEKIYYMDEVMAHYRVHAGGIWSGDKNVHTQKTALTYYNIADYTGRTDKIKEALFRLAYSVSKVGFESISVAGYYKIILQQGRRLRLKPREWVTLLASGLKRTPSRS